MGEQMSLYVCEIVGWSIEAEEVDHPLFLRGKRDQAAPSPYIMQK